MFEFGFSKRDLVRAAWAAVFAFVGAYATLVAGFGRAPEFSELRSAAIALFPAAVAAALSAVKNAVLSDRSSVKG